MSEPGKTLDPVVVKVGGGALEGGALEDVRDLAAGGRPVVLVHGGGNRLTQMLEALGVESHFVEGLRVTDEAALEVAEMVYAGHVNKTLGRGLNSLGIPAVGISGTDGPTLRVSPVPGLGRVGKVQKVEGALIQTLLNGGFVPTVAPLGLGPEGAYNVNADSAAAALAVALGAGHLFLLTDVDGLLADGELVSSLTPEECEGYVESGLAAGGMVPKLRTASEAAQGGVEARIVNGERRGVLLDALSGEKAGTLVSGR
ncbi:acetylglutamate kinase [Rubrobacter aplysinae]|uniref:acetylglutamate kinase n=1 Tax=Rubrobacter aplysinae TaxID=909625 RepID=UPI00064C0BCD|nr:acetylglutamate kinase [Rubrobacter aplysinae]